MITFKRPSLQTAAQPLDKTPAALQRVLIAGADNPLARLLAAGLQDAGLEVSVQAAAPEVQHNLKRNFTVVEHAVSDLRFAEALRDIEPQIVIHANAEAAATAAAHAPYAAFNRIVDKTVALCEAVRRAAPRSRLVLLHRRQYMESAALPSAKRHR
ncbi:MAG: NAD(P)-dependent oxidoreductase [bacterium]|nr:NAD(P)-dependent oxidoreductase [bacterium]